MKLSKEFLFLSAIASLLCFTAARAEDSGDTGTVKSSTAAVPFVSAKLIGYGSYEFGQIVFGQYSHSSTIGNTLDHYWVQKGRVQLGADVMRGDKWHLILAGEGALSFPYTLPTDGSSFGGYELYEPKFRWFIHESSLSYSFGIEENPWLKIGVGYFPFKYNKDATNFGDILFRATPYPQFFSTSFDSPYQRLLGLHLSSMLFSSLKQDLLLTSEVQLWPLRDFSLSYLIDYTLLKFADFGAGIDFDRLWPVDNSLTTPSTENGNAEKFTFAGTKVMAKVSLDFNELFSLKNLGKNGIYGELCLNGLKDYPADTLSTFYPGYNSLEKRTIAMIGISIPTYLLDNLSVEGEWWDNNYANSYYNVYLGSGNAKNPVPTKYGDNNHTQPYGGPWHWSIYGKKSLAKNISIIGQIARDHSMIETSVTGIANGDPEEALDGKYNWAWWLKVAYAF